MKYIELSKSPGSSNKGKYKAIVDDKDFEWLDNIRWHYGTFGKQKYVVNAPHIKRKRPTIWMHRLIMNCPKGLFVDHINHNTLDNRRENLRICTNQQNQFNQKPRIGHSSIYKGVSWKKDHKKWRASIKLNGKNIALGYFPTERSAAMVYDIWAKDLFGEFAYLNFYLV